MTHLLGGSERATLTRRGPPYAVEEISAELAVQIGISAHAGHGVGLLKKWLTTELEAPGP